MAEWLQARSEAELWARIRRQTRVKRIPKAVQARGEDYVREALDHGRSLRFQKSAEVGLRQFVQRELERIREKILGYGKPGGKRTGSAMDLYDPYTRVRWEASGEAEVPADFDFGKHDGHDVVIVWARPWVPPSVVARLYAFGRASFPKDVHGPHLKSLHLYLYVTDRRAEGKETWAATMEAWNEHAEDLGLPNTYKHVSNFLRDYHRVQCYLAGSTPE
jgi:hypothetical protein